VVVSSCVLVEPGTFCRGTVPCYYADWHAPYQVPSGRPVGDAQLRVRMCLESPDTYSLWVGVPVWLGSGRVGVEPSLAVQAREAVGNLRLPGGVLRFSPMGRALVGLETWWWVEGLGGGPVRGTGAFGLVAVATPGGLRVDPGDGSAVVQCPVTVTKAAAEGGCASTYERASVAGMARVGGRPAYVASATATWRVAFVDAGVPVTIPGYRPVLTGPPARAPVPVAEVQSVVEGTR
jgi:hypothetical protein